MDDNVYENLVNYLLTEQFPFDVNESNFRRKASHYRVKEKQLYKVGYRFIIGLLHTRICFHHYFD